MLDHTLAVLYVLFLWWFGTGAVAWLNGRSRGTFRWTLAGATVLLVGALWGLAATASDTGAGGAYAGFGFALLAWAWHEVAFLLGFVTGPRRTACHAGCAGWRHALHALQAILWHELAIAATAGVIIALTWGGENAVGLWTFLILWWMRASAKLNVFLGVPNLAEAFLPAHLRYLLSFLRRRPMNPLFPVSVTVSTVVTLLLAQAAGAPGTEPFQAAGLTMLAALMALAVLEHWFMVLPLPPTAFWGAFLPEPGAVEGPSGPAAAPLPGPAAAASHRPRDEAPCAMAPT